MLHIIDTDIVFDRNVIFDDMCRTQTCHLNYKNDEFSQDVLSFMAIKCYFRAIFLYRLLRD